MVLIDVTQILSTNRSYTDPYKPLPDLPSHGCALLVGVKEFRRAKLRYVTIENGELVGEIVTA